VFCVTIERQSGHRVRTRWQLRAQTRLAALAVVTVGSILACVLFDRLGDRYG
jgi:hypothetical protein